MDKDRCIESAINQYKIEKHNFQRFLNGVYDFFKLEPALNSGALPMVHSLKCRLKEESHLREKIERKWTDNDPITSDNVFDKITDLAGVRILHLYQKQFRHIHAKIMDNVSNNDWVFNETPKAYTWDPEAKSFYESLSIVCEVRETFYTSVHYVVKPKNQSPYKCEIQVRTLFEEIWGEIDHYFNYPNKIESIACREQLRVLSKLSSTGTRLADSIFNSFDEYKSLCESHALEKRPRFILETNDIDEEMPLISIP